MSDKGGGASGGIGVTGLLGVVFILAKVFEVDPVASWSWWWVLSPFWIGAALAISVVFVMIVIAAIFG